MPPFSTLSLPAPLARAVDVLGFADTTPVQAHALPPLLRGQDVIAQARTGSGKTVAFGLALLARVETERAEVQALVLCPTRELADQVTAEVRRLARFVPNLRVVTLCGGVPVREQKPSLEQPPHVVVGTPGRILDHLGRGHLDLQALRVLVLDEADRMLDMGFAEQIEQAVAATPRARQTALFSATFPDQIRALSRRLQRTPVDVTVDTETPDAEIEQTFFEVEPEGKVDAVVALLQQRRPESALIFCHTRNDTRDVTAQLVRRGYAALALHGELEQRERDEVLLRFAHKSCQVLVATDVAARGLDIKGLPLVICFELPVSPDVHVHRIGRTGRAGLSGVALSLCARRERERVAPIEARLGGPVRWGEPPALHEGDRPAPAPVVTFVVEGGRQDKLRPGDLLGALTGDHALPGGAVGKIDIHPRRSYVSIARAHAGAVDALGKVKVKGRGFRVSRLR